MSLTSKQIDELRAYAKDRKGELAKLITDAADTIEMLSAKLHASQMERSSQYYHGGWIPCSERLPKIEQLVLLSTNTKEVYVGHRNKPELMWQVEEGGRKHWVYDPGAYTDDIDRLPKAEDISFESGERYGEDWLSVTSLNYNSRFAGIVAWMPLPEPYREEGD